MKIHVFREEGVVWCCADWTAQPVEVTVPKWSPALATCERCLAAIVEYGQQAAARIDELKGGA